MALELFLFTIQIDLAREAKFAQRTKPLYSIILDYWLLMTRQLTTLKPAIRTDVWREDHKRVRTVIHPLRIPVQI